MAWLARRCSRFSRPTASSPAHAASVAVNTSTVPPCNIWGGLLISQQRHYLATTASWHPHRRAWESAVSAVHVRNMSKRAGKTVPEMAEAIMQGDRLTLSRAITLVESVNTQHKQKATELVELLLKQQQQQHAGGGSKRKTFRIGMSGPPGVGKSTLIESFGLYLIEQGFRVAILSIDPSSNRTGGSILGDKTRMQELSKHSSAFIRPSPSRGSLGGVGPATQEALQLCEAGGFDVVVVETVGVGQSETTVRDLVDTMVLVVPPGGGDELQGIKKGIVELCDAVLVNKADGAMLGPARHTKVEYMHALQILRHEKGAWRAPVMMCSAIDPHKHGIQKLWKTVVKHSNYLDSCKGGVELARGRQSVKAMYTQLQERCLELVTRDPEVQQTVRHMESQVVQLVKTPRGAAEAVFYAKFPHLANHSQ